jgi:hypothetical protein
MNKIISDLFMAEFLWNFFLWELGYEWTFNACKVCVVLGYLPVLKMQLVTVTITAINFCTVG